MIKLLNIQETAEMIGVSKRHFHRLVSNGEAPAPVRFGRLTRWRMSDLDKWLTNMPQERYYHEKKSEPADV
jgi:excisionase family DNA binding protein